MSDWVVLSLDNVNWARENLVRSRSFTWENSYKETEKQSYVFRLILSKKKWNSFRFKFTLKRSHMIND